MTRNAILAIASALVIALISLAASFAGSVNGYTRKDGTYVAPYERSAPDNSYNNNWSVRGNTNPYTGEVSWSWEIGQGVKVYSPG